MVHPAGSWATAAEKYGCSCWTTQADLFMCPCCTGTSSSITHGVRHGDGPSETFTAYLGRRHCLLSSSPGPSWSLPPDLLCRAAALVAPAAGWFPVGTDRSPPRGPGLKPRPGRRWSLAVRSPSCSRMVRVPMGRSKNVAPGWDRRGESRWGEERGTGSGCAKHRTAWDETAPEIRGSILQNKSSFDARLDTGLPKQQCGSFTGWI